MPTTNNQESIGQSAMNETRRRFVRTIVILAIVIAIVNLSMFPLVGATASFAMLFALMGVFYAQSALIGVWVALGYGRAYYRVVWAVGLLAVELLTLNIWIAPDWEDVFQFSMGILACGFAVMLVAIALRAIAGLRLGMGGDIARATQHELQLTWREWSTAIGFAVILMLAAFFADRRYGLLADYLDELPELGFLYASIALLTLPAVYVLLREKKRVLWGVAFFAYAVVVTIAGKSAMELFLRRHDDEIWFCFLPAFSVSIAIGLLALRWANVRVIARHAIDSPTSE